MPGLLIVDDEEQVLRLLDEVFRQVGFEVWRAASGREAAELFRAHHRDIALALIDVHMADLDGLETLEALRAIDPSLGCCFITADSSPYTIDELFTRGACLVFHKPFDLTGLTRAVRHLVFGPPSRAATSQPFPADGIDRRRFPRWQGQPQDVTIAPIGVGEPPTPGTVVNCSLGGVCLVADVPRAPGTVMRVRSLATSYEKWLAVEVRHACAHRTRWTLGCRFIDPPTLGVLSLYG
jgi:CheY-like chemotaxis protein